MKKGTKAAIAASAAAAVYGVAAYGATKALMDVAMKRDLPQQLHGKGSHLTGEREDEGYRAAQREAAQKLGTSHTETVLLRSREGLTLVGHFRKVENAERILIAFHGWRSAWYRDFGLLSEFWEKEKCSVLLPSATTASAGCAGSWITAGAICPSISRAFPWARRPCSWPRAWGFPRRCAA